MNKKREKEIRKLVESLPGFKLVRLFRSKRQHTVAVIRDDAGNVFKSYLANTSCCLRSDKNFRSDIKRASNHKKGLIG